ncbi:MAG: SH3 domain-containing protein [Chloroflexota bacterium]|nr:SH3 domain-containing protein [Chloroflexota bacterium]
MPDHHSSHQSPVLSILTQRSQRRWRVPVALSLGLALALTACTPRSPSTTNPASVQAQPDPAMAATAVSMPPATPVASPTPRPTASPADIAAEIQAAVERTKAAGSYEVDFRVTAEGSAAAVGGGADTDRRQSLFRYDGAVHGNAFHVVDLRDPFLPSAGNPNHGLELLSVDRQLYAHGPLPLPRATKDAWYHIGELPAQGGRPFLHADVILSRLFEMVDATELVPVKSERRDQQLCSVYQSERMAAAQAVSGFGMWTKPGPEPSLEEQLKEMELDEHTFKAWLCEDGLVHRVEVLFGGQMAAKPETTFRTEIELHLSKFGTVAPIAAPEGAVPLASPDALALLPLELTARVQGSGQLRAQPEPEGQVLAELASDDVVHLLRRNQPGTWYLIVAPGRSTGWADATMLAIDPGVAARVEVAAQP